MLVDNPPTSPPLAPFPMDALNLNDFFNFDLAPASSRSSSGSPGSDPATPPQQQHPEPFFSATQDATDMFNMFLADDYSKLGPGPAPDFDLFPLNMGMSAFTSSDASSSNDSQSPSHLMSIDPQLVDKPTPSVSAQADDDDDDDLDLDAEENDEPEPLPTIKVGGKGRGRKGTVASGGVTKKAPTEKKTSAAAKQFDDDDIDDWRPSPEEYKKLSSKEKRQLRNKISARNFRIRRKEYITTLEGDIAQRDRLIDAIRTELTSTSAENSALRQEISALKKALLSGREAPVLPPPSPLPSTAAPATPTRNSSPLVTANTQKDLPTSPSMRPFWGGAFANGGITSVHTTLVPDFPSLSASALAGKASVPGARGSPPLQENMNPALNPTSAALASLLAGAAHAQAQANGGGDNAQLPQGFDDFSDMNQLTFKNVDNYRMRLWGRVAAQNNGAKPQQQQQNLQQQSATLQQLLANQQRQQQQQQPGGLAGNMRPHFFASPTLFSSQTLAGKPASSSSSTRSALSNASNTHAHTSLSASLNSTGGAPTPQHALLASIASQTLVGRMSSAFWDAFSGGNNQKSWDADKVRKVLEGKAVVRVVDLEPAELAKVPATASSSKAAPSTVDTLEESMARLALAKTPSASSPTSASASGLGKKPSMGRFHSEPAGGMSVPVVGIGAGKKDVPCCVTSTSECFREATGLYAAVHKK